MKASLQKNKSFFIIVLLAITIVAGSRCVSSSEAKPDLRGNAYAGAERCQTCHAAVYENYMATAHAHTTQPPGDFTIKGNFDIAHNGFYFSDAWKVVMEKHNDSFYQTAFYNGQQKNSYPFDVVVGSGRKAQTFLYYNNKAVFQLPISYFVPEHTWANSPNFPSDAPKFDRSIPSGCFGCHSSAVGLRESYQGLQKSETFEKGKIIYGIDCERCHGAAAEHVTYQESHPGDNTARFITSIRTLNRQQSVDMCGICHSGTKNMQRSAFDFKPGEVREDYFFPDYGNPLTDQLDVHGNQYALMKGSRCYLESNELTCNSCHNPHQKEQDNVQLFSQRCVTCHQQVIHSFRQKISSTVIAANCIDCHMPKKASSVITLLTQQKTAAKADSIRTHFIKIYKEETDRFLAAAKN